jgi:hypothetical protein
MVSAEGFEPSPQRTSLDPQRDHFFDGLWRTLNLTTAMLVVTA